MARLKLPRRALVDAADRLPNEALHHHRGVGAPRQAELDLDHAGSAVQVVRLGRADTQSVGPHDGNARFGLELEPSEVRHIQRVGRQAEPLEGSLVQLQLQRIGDSLKLPAGEHKGALPFGRQLKLSAGETQHPLDAAQADAIREVVLDPEAERAIPKVRLEGVEVNEALPRSDAVECPLEIVWVALEMFEDRVVTPELARDGAAAVPVAPGTAQSFFHSPPRGWLKGRRARDEVLQRGADVAL